jgi:predicted nucleic acid-binding protein
LIAIDTSVAVAAFASWHEWHDAARRLADQDVRLVAHCALETYSVLTRLPPPHRAPAEVVREFLSGRFREPLLVLPAREYRQFVTGMAARGIAGGAAYDALVAACAAHAGATLATGDRRAAPVYEQYGVPVRWVP